MYIDKQQVNPLPDKDQPLSHQNFVIKKKKNRKNDSESFHFKPRRVQTSFMTFGPLQPEDRLAKHAFTHINTS